MNEEELNLFWSELTQKCKELNTNEFEFHWEMWGFDWHPWFIKVDGISLHFSVYGLRLSKKYVLSYLVEQGKIEIVKEYDKSEMDIVEYDKTRYRIIGL